MSPAAAPDGPVDGMPLSGWGRYPRLRSRVVAAPPDGFPDKPMGRGVIARGNGRSYGDAAIGTATTMMTGGLSRFRGFDPETGWLRVEAGVQLADIISTVLPMGFFPVVVPGTQFVTVGGMIASDVHGKNHHVDGGFGAHVDNLVLLRPDGTPLACSRDRHPDVFAATIGGMGLTGLIREATVRLRRVESGWIRQETCLAADLAQMLAALDASSHATYSVAWIDCSARASALGRGLVYLGEHAGLADCRAAGRPAYPPRSGRALTVPPGLPDWTMNRPLVRAFNALYHRRGAARAGEPALVPWRNYFFPLDGLNHWNRLYGRRGFLQHQCVVPVRNAHAVLSDLLATVSRLGSASPLAVLKRLGRGHGGLSFPMDGYTLALDLPAGPAELDLLARLDRIVVAAGGRLYLAKDARQARETFEAGYPDLAAFRTTRRNLDAEGAFASHLSKRLGLSP